VELESHFSARNFDLVVIFGANFALKKGLKFIWSIEVGV
jgi:hypothetical protein